MAGKAHFEYTAFQDGMQEVVLSSWKWFADYIQKHLVDYKTYVFRGQRKSTWSLESTLDRSIRSTHNIGTDFNYDKYLEGFKASTRGRRGPNPQELSEDDWWALGQHHGLATPLLDWTESPFVALFFAFAKPRERITDNRAVWAISRYSIEYKSRQLSLKTPPEDGIKFITPQSDENARLVNQRGLFTRAPNSVTHERWMDKHYKGHDRQILIKIIIPEIKNDRADCLKFLNRMNINHLTLFPDLYGSSKYCDTALEIKNY